MTGLRLDTAVNKLRKRLSKLAESASASSFQPELVDFTKRVLKDCVTTTPVRSEKLITDAQLKQYRNRVNYIPSVHSLVNPSLIVKEDGAWIFMDGKWYNAEWRLPSPVFAALQELTVERERRLQTAQSDFVNQRKQARFLYHKSWWQVAQSLSISLLVNQEVIDSRTRRKPPQNPPRAFGQWRGGKRVISAVIQNPFLDEETAYFKGNGKAILSQAIATNRARFYKEVEDKVKRLISAQRQSA